MQPPRRKGRPIERPLPLERPLVYETLSDPILVTRARDGDRRALAALCERHAPGVERITGHVLRDPEDARDDPVRAAELASLRRELRAYLREISAAQARVVVLRDALGLTFEQIATASGMPVGTAKCYALRGRSRLQARLAERAVA